ncbi:MAG TPA: NAD+ synthase, partial [Candidatus Thermoplasmatota archaeon]|nr:NAD+ synthase [Candidatus Thermoplasmatota archaeon]
MKLSLDVDAPALRAQLVGFLDDYVGRSGAGGVVVGLSGGLDSAVVMALCAEALGPRKVLALLMPAEDSSARDAAHARLVAAQWKVPVEELPIQAIVDATMRACKHKPTKLAAANARARARMMLLYHHANSLGRLVAATGNKSELLVGYFTKHGDGAGDLHPIGDLYKTQVRALAQHMAIPRAILAKPPTAGLWAGQTDEQELGVRYADLDRILLGFELQLSDASIARRARVPPATVRKVQAMVQRS